MSLLLRVASVSELPIVAGLMNTAYRCEGLGRSWTSEAGYIDGDRTSVAALRDDIERNPEALLLVAPRDAGAIEGCVWLEPRGNGVWYLGSLTVDPEVQNSGLGRRLLASAEAWAVERGARTIRMTVVNGRDTLIAWYERRGYRLTGERVPFPYKDKRFGVPRQEGLAFVVLEKVLPTE